MAGWLNKACWTITILVCVGLVICAFVKPEGTHTILEAHGEIGFAGVIPGLFGFGKAAQTLGLGKCLPKRIGEWFDSEDSDVSTCTREARLSDACEKRNKGLYFLFVLALCAGGVLFALYGINSFCEIKGALSFVVPGAILLGSGVVLLGVQSGYLYLNYGGPDHFIGTPSLPVRNPSESLIAELGDESRSSLGDGRPSLSQSILDGQERAPSGFEMTADFWGPSEPVPKNVNPFGHEDVRITSSPRESVNVNAFSHQNVPITSPRGSVYAGPDGPKE